MDIYAVPSGDKALDAALGARITDDTPWLWLAGVITGGGGAYMNARTPLTWTLSDRGRAVLVCRVPHAGWTRVTKDRVTWGATARDSLKAPITLMDRAALPAAFADADVTLVLVHPMAGAVSVIAGGKKVAVKGGKSESVYGVEVIDPWQVFPVTDTDNKAVRADAISRGIDLLAVPDRRRRGQIVDKIEDYRVNVTPADLELAAKKLHERYQAAGKLLPKVA